MRLEDYSDVLRYAHRRLAPGTYLEIGVFKGKTFRHAGPDTIAVGVDPEPLVSGRIEPNRRIFAATSDRFFDDHVTEWTFNRRPLDFAFIDGMHLFEHALRDFLNVERIAHHGSIVAMHDCLPTSEVMTGREYLPELTRWTGDVWKVLSYLVNERDDLDVTVLDAPPTGLTVIRSLDPDRGYSDAEIDEVVDRYRDQTYDDYLSLRSSLGIVPITRANLDEVFPRTAFAVLSPARRVRHNAWCLRQGVLAGPLGPWLRSVRARVGAGVPGTGRVPEDSAVSNGDGPRRSRPVA